MCSQVLAVDITEDFRGVKPGDDLVAVRITPAHGREDEAVGAELVDDAGADELGDGGGAVVGCAGLLVELGGGLEDFDGDGVLC